MMEIIAARIPPLEKVNKPKLVNKIIHDIWWIVGEKEFEAACFDFIHKEEFESRDDIPQLFQMRAKILAQKLGLDFERLSSWVFVRLVLGACWMLEDRGEPDEYILQVSKIFLDSRD